MIFQSNMIKVTRVEKLFPSIEEVFEAPKEWFKCVFFPLLTVEIENEQQQKVTPYRQF